MGSPGAPGHIYRHLLHYAEPIYQRFIVCIIFMVPMNRIEGEQAKMTAWENMQKAKAEAAVQKLVMKLEKRKSYSLERIFNTLRSAHRKTQVVRSTTANHDQQISRAVKRTSHLTKNGQMSSLSGCFT